MLSLEEEIIIDRSRHPRFEGNLENFNLVGEGANPICGDEVKYFIHLENNIVKNIAHSSRACSICKASADLWAERLVGQPLSFPDATEALNIIPFKLSATRSKCALLPYEVLKNIKNNAATSSDSVSD